VGHETDVTLAELVADVRAATPSNAAEIVVPARDALRAEVDAWQRRLARALEVRIDRERLKLERAERRLRDPRSALGSVERALGLLTRRLEEAMRRPLARQRRELTALEARVAPHDPRRQLARQRGGFEALEASLQRAMQARLAAETRQLVRAGEALAPAAERALREARMVLGQQVAALDALSPLSVLGRGYAIALRADGRALREPSDVRVGDTIEVRVARARISAEVRAVTSDASAAERQEERA